VFASPDRTLAQRDPDAMRQLRGVQRAERCDQMPKPDVTQNLPARRQGMRDGKIGRPHFRAGARQWPRPWLFVLLTFHGTAC
jgi:hypothetical protein